MQSLWMLAAAALFAVMGVFVKLAAARYAVLEIVLYRSLVAVLMLLVYVQATGGSLATRLPWTHLRRGAIGTAALSLWFYATAALPLGTAITLNYTSPLFMAAGMLVAALLRGLRLDGRLLATLALGFIGVVLTLQPAFDRDHAVPALAGLLSGAVSAVAVWHVRELGRLGEPESRVVFYFSLSGLVLGLAGTLVTGFTPHGLAGAGQLLGVGVTATLAQLAMTRAFARGRALLVANLQYTTIVFAATLGVVVFDDRLPLQGWIGIAIILASGIAATWVSARAAARARADALRAKDPIEPSADN